MIAPFFGLNMSELIINRILSKPQYDYYHSTAKNNAIVAGVGSGKTDISVKRILDTMFTYRGANLGYFAPTIPLIKDIFYPKISEELDELGVNHRILDQKNIVNIPGYGKIYCRTMNNPEGIVGFEILDAFLDEFDLLKLKNGLTAYRKIKARCRQKVRNIGIQRKYWKNAGYKMKYKPSQMFVSTTPEGFNTTYRLFKKKPTKGNKNDLYLKNSALFELSTYHNLHNLPPDYIDELRATYPPQLIDAYILGRFVNLFSGTVYTSFSRVLNNAPDISPFGVEPIHIGMDFNVMKMAAIVHVIRQGMPIACDEFCNLLDTPTMIKAIRNRYPRNPIIVYPDCAGNSRDTTDASKSDIKLLRLAGFRVLAHDAHPRIKDRVTSMNGMFCNALGERRYLVNVDMCPVYTEGIEQQVYNEAGLPDKSSGLDHCFSGSTIIRTKTGTYHFENAPKNGKVLIGENKWADYVNARCVRKAVKTMKYTFLLHDGGSYIITCTPDHEFLSEENEWKSISEMELGTKVFVERNTDSLKVTGDASKKKKVSFIFIVKFGNSILEKSKRIMLSIISILTKKIMKSKTLKWCQRKNIADCTRQENILQAHLQAIQKVKKRPKNGISQKRGTNGIKNITKKQRKSSIKSINSIVRFVIRNIKLKNRTKTCIVPISVKRNQDGYQGLMISNRFVNTVKQNFLTRNIPKENTVAELVTIEAGKIEDVYCLTVPKYGFFKLNEKSPLVKNCNDAGGYFIEYKYGIIRPTANSTNLIM